MTSDDRFLKALADVYKEIEPLELKLQLAELARVTRCETQDNGNGTYTHTFTFKSAQELAEETRNN